VVDKTSQTYLPACIAHAAAAAIHFSVGIPRFTGSAAGEGDFFRCTLAGDGAAYCFRGEDETKIVFPAGLRLRDCERMDAVGLDERPLLYFKGEGLGLIRSSHASSSDDVESCGISAVRCSSFVL
jgi:hypothetical protein